MLAALTAVLIGAIDLSIIATILPSIVTELNVNTADIDRYIWIVNAYLIAYIAAIPLAGRMSDLVGRRTIFLACLVIFLLGSILCASADTLEQLIAGRAVQGAGGGGLLPVAMALAGDLFSRRRHLAAIGTIASVETFGWIVGPSYGAAIAAISGNDDQGWRWVFWLNVPIIVVVGWGIRSRIPGPPLGVAWPRIRRLDAPGAILLLGAIVFLCLGLTSSGELASSEQGLRAFGGTPNPLADRLPLLLGLAATSLALLIGRLRTAREPILPKALFSLKGYVASVVANFLTGTVMMISVVNVPVVVALLVTSNDVSWTSALLLAPLTIGIAVAAALSDRIARQLSSRSVAIGGTLLITAGLIALYPLLESLDIWRMTPAVAVLGIGIGMLLPPLGTAALTWASDNNRGAAASTLIMARLLGMTIGVSALTALGVRRLQVLTSRLDPVIQGQDESTAHFLARQQEFIVEHAIPLAVQVIQETFVLAAAIAVLGLIPILAMERSGEPQLSDVLRE
jgi:MFS family permease